MRTVLFAANRGYALTNSREALIVAFLEGGWRVVLATADDAEAHQLAAAGAQLAPVAFNRGGLAAAADLVAYRQMCELMRRYQPDLVHNFHAKPVILGSRAARRHGPPTMRIVNTITGLGHAFITGGMTARLAGLGYRSVLPRADLTIFQNRDDRALFIARGWVPEDRTRLIVGSGIDITRFAWVDRAAAETRAPVVVMLGRLLRQKGTGEFAEVARRIRRSWPEARFALAGEEDPVHPDAVSAQSLEADADISYLGRLSDVVPLLRDADLLLFPSYYREGVPRAIMEAAATGLPTVAFDVPGVREAVRDGETGYLVAERDVAAMAGRVSELLGDAALRLRMGRAARQLAERSFDIRAILGQHIALYSELGVAPVLATERGCTGHLPKPSRREG